MNTETHKYSGLWKMLENQKYVYGIAFKTNTKMYVVEPADEVTPHVSLRFFLTVKSAEQYMEALIEQNDYRPSELHILKIPLNDIQDICDELADFAFNKLNQDVKVFVSEMRNGDIVAEDTLYDTSMYLN